MFEVTEQIPAVKTSLMHKYKHDAYYRRMRTCISIIYFIYYSIFCIFLPISAFVVELLFVDRHNNKTNIHTL